MLQIGSRLDRYQAAADATVRIKRVQIIGRIAHHRSERNLLRDVDTAAFVESCQGQQILHQHRHTRTGGFDMFDGFVGAFKRPRHIALHLIEFRIAMNGGQRRTQLMTGVGDELLHLLRCLRLCMEALLDTGQHGVERHRQRADLGVFRHIRNTLTQVAGRDFRRRLLDALERSECALHHDGA